MCDIAIAEASRPLYRPPPQQQHDAKIRRAANFAIHPSHLIMGLESNPRSVAVTFDVSGYHGRVYGTTSIPWPRPILSDTSWIQCANWPLNVCCPCWG